MAHLYQIYREQLIDTDLKAAWRFISNPENLSAITPDDMEFTIVSAVPPKMYEGLIIEYRIGIPLLGKQTWLSEIKHIKEGHSFVDEQRLGPYKLWYHHHEIAEHPKGVCFTDHVYYALPYGVLGSLAHNLYVRRQLRKIFDFRKEAMKRLLGKEAASTRHLSLSKDRNLRAM